VVFYILRQDKKIDTRLRSLLVFFLLAIVLLGLWLFRAVNSDDETSLSSESVNENLDLDRDQLSVFPILYEGYLANPGMGWQGDLSHASSYFPETVYYADRTSIPWMKLNPLEDVYDWTLLDEQFSQARAAGKQISFRVFTMSGESYGGHQIPDWVLGKGAIILSSGEPDYSNCTYQEQWGKFVNTLLERYDGNSEIAFMDISGYGNFNEWSWQDQTEWDALWAKQYEQKNADSSAFENLDGQSRRRLVDIFIGGSYKSHQCRDGDGNIQLVNYYYEGAKKTQLVMPYAGILQSTQYVFTKRKDVGFRFDCLGRDDALPLTEISEIWASAPIVYEFCGSRNFDADVAQTLVEGTHPSFIHNNNYYGDLNTLEELIVPIGYRFFLEKAGANTSVNAGEKLAVPMFWQNNGTAPIYVKMGANPKMYLYLTDELAGEVVVSAPVNVDFSTWMPADPFLSSNLKTYHVDASIPIPTSLPAGSYIISVVVMDDRTGLPIQLAMEGVNANGEFVLFNVEVK